jgi:FkbM family methyltransferase
MEQLILKLYRFLFARKVVYKLNKFFLFCCLRGLGMLNCESLAISGEKYFLDKLVSGLKLRTVLDVGGNKGEYARMIRELCPDAKICSFEPHPMTYGLLSEVARNYQFDAYNFGLGGMEGTLELHDYALQNGSPFATVHGAALDNEQAGLVVKHEVQIRTLDDFVAEQQIDSIDLLKIDTEGNEYAVLVGGRKTLAAGRIKVIQFEFNEMNIYSRVFFKDFHELLAKDYALYRLLPGELLSLQRYTPMMCEIFVFQNIVAVRKDINRELFPA